MANRNQNADELMQQVRQQNYGTDNNLTAMIERIMLQNGMNGCFHRPNFASPLSEYILQTDLPPRGKVPKFTKFSGDTTESTVEHVARYLIEAGEIENNENLRIKYFPIGSPPSQPIRSTIGTNWKDCSMNNFTWVKPR